MSKISLKHSGGKVVSLNSPTTEPNANDVAFKLPNADGSDGQALVTDGAGNLSFANAGSGTARNLIINGAAQINQRGNQTAISSGGTNYTLDRWSLSLVNGGTWSVSQSTDTPDGFGNSIKLDCTTADTSLGASDYLLIRQKLEGQNVQAFAKGTSSAKQFALSFYLKTNKTGVYTIELRDNDNSRTCGKTITVSNSNWNRYTLIFPADTTGVFDNNNEDSLQLNIWLAAGSDYTSGTLQTVWGSQTNANRISSSNVNLADNTSNEWLITGVQLEVGSVATDFEHRSFGQELALCQRYFHTLEGDDNDFLEIGFSVNCNNHYMQHNFPQPMRIMPSYSSTSTNIDLLTANSSTNINANTLAIVGPNNTPNPYSCWLYGNTSCSTTAGQAAVFRPNANGLVMSFSAEL